MDYRVTFDFYVIDEAGEERPFIFTVLAADMAEAQALWRSLLEVLPAGRVGGGVREAGKDAEEGEDGP